MFPESDATEAPKQRKVAHVSGKRVCVTCSGNICFYFRCKRLYCSVENMVLRRWKRPQEKAGGLRRRQARRSTLVFAL